MGAEIRREFPDADLELIQGGGGDFIVIRDDELLWDKRAMGDEFPDTSEILARLRS